MTNGVYSDFELREMGIKFVDEEIYTAANCVGSCEEEMEAKVITKKCRGVVVKTTVRGTGNGTLKISMHCPMTIYDGMYGMVLDTLIEGVKAYGQNSHHKEFSVTQRVFDEDGVEKLKAYPKCILMSGKANKIENGAEEVAEIELEVSVMPDEFGNGMYEALATTLTEGTIAKDWLTKFTPSMVQVESA